MPQQSPSTPPPPPPEAPATPGVPGAPVIVGGGAATPGTRPSDLYSALRAQRRVLVEQRESLEEQREELAASLEEQPQAGAAARQGIEQRISTVDQRIAEIDQLVAASEREIARVAGIPGATVQPPTPRNDDGPPEFAAMIAVVFMIFVLFPIALAYARRIWRRSSQVVVSMPGEIAEHFTRLEQAVESVAIEVERISEGQRFVTKILAAGRGSDAHNPAALGAGAAQPVEVKAAQPEPAYRPGPG